MGSSHSAGSARKGSRRDCSRLLAELPDFNSLFERASYTAASASAMYYLLLLQLPTPEATMAGFARADLHILIKSPWRPAAAGPASRERACTSRKRTKNHPLACVESRVLPFGEEWKLISMVIEMVKVGQTIHPDVQRCLISLNRSCF